MEKVDETGREGRERGRERGEGGGREMGIGIMGLTCGGWWVVGWGFSDGLVWGLGNNWVRNVRRWGLGEGLLVTTDAVGWGATVVDRVTP